MLCSEWTPTDIQKWEKAVKGLNVNKTSNPDMPEKRITAKRKLKEVTDTVFKVSLPLTKGSVLLERTSASMDSLPVSPGYSPSSDSDLNPLPVSQSDCELDCDTGPLAFNHDEQTSQLQQDVCSEGADADQYMEPKRNLTVTVIQGVDGNFSDNEYFNQSEDKTGRKCQKNDDFNRLHSSQERSREGFYKNWQYEYPQTKHEWMTPPASHTEHWPSYNSYYGYEAGCTEQWYTSAPQSQVGTIDERLKKMSSDATQHYYQQQFQNQYMAQDHTSVQTGSVGQHSLPDVHSDPARTNMHPHTGAAHAHSGSTAPEPGVLFDYEQLQTYKEFTTGHVLPAQQNYMTQSTAHQVIQVGHGMMMSNLSYNMGPSTNSDQHFPHSLGGGDGGYGGGHGAYSDLNVRGAGLSHLTISGGSDGTTPSMFAYPNFNSACVTTLY